MINVENGNCEGWCNHELTMAKENVDLKDGNCNVCLNVITPSKLPETRSFALNFGQEFYRHVEL
jgi:hypothetical protein